MLIITPKNVRTSSIASGPRRGELAHRLLRQQPLGEVHPLVQLRHLGPELVHVRHLGPEVVHLGEDVLGGLAGGPAPPDPGGDRLADRAERDRHEGPAAEDEADREDVFHGPGPPRPAVSVCVRSSRLARGQVQAGLPFRPTVRSRARRPPVAVAASPPPAVSRYRTSIWPPISPMVSITASTGIGKRTPLR